MGQIKNREEFRAACDSYLRAKARDKGGAWNSHAIKASRLGDQIVHYGREVQKAGRCTIAQAVEAMPDTYQQRRMADHFYWCGTREEWSEALRAIDFGDEV